MIQQERPVQMPAACPKYGASSKHLLLIGDEPDTRLIVSICLEGFEQWRIITSNSQNFQYQLDSKTWDIILLDINPYKKSGLECLRQLNTHPSTAGVPVIMLTAWVMPQDYERFQQMALAGIIAKPFDPILLGQRIKKILNW